MMETKNKTSTTNTSMETPALLHILEGGDLRSDGRSNELVSKILRDPCLLPEVIKGLSVSDQVVRGRTADTLEKVSRIHHEKMVRYLPILLEKAVNDEVYMVRFHIAMILGYLEVSDKTRSMIINTLFQLLDDDSVFVKSWSIVSLTVIGLEEELFRDAIIMKIKPLLECNSKAIRRKAENSYATLQFRQPIPKGWVKKNL